jgi:DNA-binding CsgD family transcriptional regulator/membrane protein implicated in regulation of membrane protease activity
MPHNSIRNFPVLLLLLLTGTDTLLAQLQLDRPRIKNFTKGVYQADNQNWSITQDNEGTLYVANNRGLLTFDGIRWTCLSMPRNTIVRSVTAGDSGRILTGSYEEFGYWEKDRLGKLQYTSLIPLLKNYTFHNEEVWKIIQYQGITYFQTFSVIFAWNGKTVEVLRPPGFIDCFSLINQRLYLVISNHGLFELRGQKIDSLDPSPFFRNTLIRVMLPFDDRKILVATANTGLFLYDSTGLLTPWASGLSELLQNTSINRGLLDNQDNIVLGTILDGIFLLDRQGKLLFHLNKQNGLQNNTVLGLHIDQDGALWAGLDNGIDIVQPDNSITFYEDPTGRLGSVYTVLLKDQLLYAGTNQGLFCSPFIPRKGGIQLNFSLVENSQGQVWTLQEQNGQVICGHNDRSYELIGNRISLLSPVSGGYALLPLRVGEKDYLLQSTYTDFVLLEKINNRWSYSRTIEGFRNPMRHAETDHLGNIWVSHLQQGIYRIRLNQELTAATEVHYYGRARGFASDNHISVFKLQNRVVFVNEGRLFIYNDLADTIVPFTYLEDRLQPETRVRSIFPAGGELYWLVTSGSLDLYELGANRVILRKTLPLGLFNYRLIQGNEYIYSIDSTHWMVCMENGLALVSEGPEPRNISLRNAFINEVLTTGRTVTGYPPRILPGQAVPELPFGDNNIEFSFSCPVFDSPLRFAVMLEGLDTGWIITDQPSCHFDRVPWGRYTFHVKAIDSRGLSSLEATWPFVISAPWYWNKYSGMLYLLFVILLLILARAYLLRRLRKQETRLSLEKEQEMIRLQNEKLEAEVHYKSMQLANTTYSIIKKNELLLEIKRILSRSRKATDALPGPQIREINRLLEQSLSNEDDWSVFEQNFEQAHEEFLKRIKKQYPQLTPGDLKLCAFIRMNLPSKKIAPLLGISIRGVENHRYRLRTKMELDRDINLTDYLMNF